MASVPFGLCWARVLAKSASDPTNAVPVPLGPTRAAEVPEAPFEVLIKESIEDGVETAVGVSERHAEEVGGHDRGGLRHTGRERFDQDEDVYGRPAHHKHSDHNQHQAGDASQVAVFFPGARQQADALKAQDHECVANGDDEERSHEGEDEDADLHQCVPVDVWVWKLQSALCSACRRDITTAVNYQPEVRTG